MDVEEEKAKFSTVKDLKKNFTKTKDMIICDICNGFDVLNAMRRKHIYSNIQKGVSQLIKVGATTIYSHEHFTCKICEVNIQQPENAKF